MKKKPGQEARDARHGHDYHFPDRDAAVQPAEIATGRLARSSRPVAAIQLLSQVVRQQHGVDDVDGEGSFFGHRLGHPGPSATPARRPQPHRVPVVADGDGVALVGGRVGGQRAHRHPVERLEQLPAVGGRRAVVQQDGEPVVGAEASELRLELGQGFVFGAEHREAAGARGALPEELARVPRLGDEAGEVVAGAARGDNVRERPLLRRVGCAPMAGVVDASELEPGRFVVVHEHRLLVYARAVDAPELEPGRFARLVVEVGHEHRLVRRVGRVPTA
uniref:Uncharacterized protein n=1 Tax=Triticum urartu TaxID=4572 RepID=A0A8R7PBU0_TRIUA